MMRLMSATAVLAATLHAAGAFAAPPTVPVTACGQVVPVNARAVLASDLDCTGEPVGVVLSRRARLSLGGFTLTSGFNGVQCDASCTVTGPGSISGGQSGVVGQNVKVSGVTISDAVIYGVSGTLVDLEGVTVTDSGFFAVEAHRSTRITGRSLIGGFGGVSGGRAIVKSSTITTEVFGISATLVSLKDGSTIATGGGPEQRTIRTDKRPHLSSDSSCSGVSFNTRTGGSWGVCSLD